MIRIDALLLCWACKLLQLKICYHSSQECLASLQSSPNCARSTFQAVTNQQGVDAPIEGTNVAVLSQPNSPKISIGCGTSSRYTGVAMTSTMHGLWHRQCFCHLVRANVCRNPQKERQCLRQSSEMIAPDSVGKDLRQTHLFCASQSDQGVCNVLLQVRVQACCTKGCWHLPVTRRM